jgi:hypothetical protein
MQSRLSIICSGYRGLVKTSLSPLPLYFLVDSSKDERLFLAHPLTNLENVTQDPTEWLRAPVTILVVSKLVGGRVPTLQTSTTDTLPDP